MDRTLVTIAERLNQRLMTLDPVVDRDTLIWAHGFLSGIVKGIEARVPKLMDSNALTMIQSVREQMSRMSIGSGPADLECQDPIEEDPGEPEAPFPAKPRTGPQLRSGGTALPLPAGHD